jgi:putative nucleotidyltransferase with HDIG domain
MKFKKYSVIVYVILLFLISVAIVVYLFPKEKKFQYSFSEGSPWLHNDLMAPFDFPVYKTESELKAEKDSINNNFIPYFVYDTIVKNEIVENYTDGIENIWKDEIAPKIDNLDYSNFEKSLLLKKFELFKIFVDSFLSDAYKSGVVSVPDTAFVKEKFRFFLYDGNISKLNYSGSFSFLEDVRSDFMELYTKSGLAEIDSLSGFKIRKYIIKNEPEANIVYDSDLSEELLKNQLESVSTSRGLVQKGELVILKGNIVGDYENKVLLSLKKEVESDNSEVNHFIISFGVSLLFLSLYLVIFLYLYYHDRKILNSFKANTFFTLQMLLLIGSVLLVFNYTNISINIVPFTLFPLLLYTFYRFNVSFFIYFASILVAGFFAPNSFEFVFIQIITGLIAMFSLRNTRKRSQIFISMIYVFLTYLVINSGFILMKQGEFTDIISSDIYVYGISSVLILLYLPIVYLYEKIFGFLSDFTLMELSDTNNPALRKLAEESPGTFQHSVQVANLVESVTRDLGGNYLLARTGSLYHDIGKSVHPDYFIENQNGANIHDKLDFEESAQRIISHVNSGVELARKYNLPAQVVNFITMHHGTSLTKYFYNSWINENPGIAPNISNFKYPGPKPDNIETVVMMMADAIEAASRTLKVYTSESIEKLVSAIIDSQLSDGQYDNVEITMRQISTAKKIFTEKISNIYHSRIVYPEIKK